MKMRESQQNRLSLELNNFSVHEVIIRFEGSIRMRERVMRPLGFGLGDKGLRKGGGVPLLQILPSRREERPIRVKAKLDRIGKFILSKKQLAMGKILQNQPQYEYDLCQPGPETKTLAK